MLVTNLSAQGTNQSNALLLETVPGCYMVFSTVVAGTGVRLPSASPLRREFVICNRGANTLLIYPPVGSSINGLSVNASVSLSPASSIRLIADGTGNYWSF